MKCFTFLIGLTTLFASGNLQSQHFKYARLDTVSVEKNNLPLKMPWAGGFNAPQFSEIDINQDGIQDLFVFDRSSVFSIPGNNIKTFINTGTAGTISYERTPAFDKYFPDNLSEYAQLRDFNCDGKADIFSYAPGGFRVYSNESSSSDLTWGLYTNYLKAIIFGPSGVYNLSSDIAGIEDLENDGDLDILTFNIGAATFIEMYQNETNDCDTMQFVRRNGCWGKFFENALNDSIVLNAACKRGRSFRHAGSTILPIDIDGNGIHDLLLGDVDNSDVTMLMNTGNDTSAFMSSVDYKFPSYDTPVDIDYFPAPFHLDVDNDGVKDLIFARNDRNKGQDVDNAHFYKNLGTAGGPTNFNLQQTDFLVGEMIDVGTMAYPAMTDIDGDGDQDLIISNFGYFDDYDFFTFQSAYISQMAYFENTGSDANPAFKLINDDYLNFSNSGLVNIVPTFGDLDGDGDDDMLIGEVNGSIRYYRNDAVGGVSNYVLVDSNYFGLNIQTYPMPFLYDMDADGLLDLLVGRREGTIHLYLNTGTSTSADFSKLSNNKLGGLDFSAPGAPGFPHPFVGDLDNSGQTILAVANNKGELLFYEGIDNNLGGNFTRKDSLKVIHDGRLSISGALLFDTDSLDLLIGQETGGMFLMSLDSALFDFDPFLGDTVSSEEVYPNEQGLRIFPNPASQSLVLETRRITRNDEILWFYDITGRPVKSVRLDRDVIRLDIKDLPKGIYILQAGSKTQKLVIE
jgi:hypothetical protein